jgi:hypothetical protein
MDGVEKDLRNFGMGKWETKAQEWDAWRRFLEQQPMKSCSTNNNNNNQHSVFFPFFPCLFVFVYLNQPLRSSSPRPENSII